MRNKEGAAPAQGQPGKLPTVIESSEDGINVSPLVLDVRIRGGHYVRYTSDPRPGATSGLWRAAGGDPPVRISPYALVEISVGCGESYVISTIFPRTGERRVFDGDIDQIASALYQSGVRIGAKNDRKLIYWAVYEFCAAARRRAERSI